MLAFAPLVWSPLAWSGDDMPAFVGCFHVTVTAAVAAIEPRAAAAELDVAAATAQITLEA